MADAPDEQMTHLQAEAARAFPTPAEEQYPLPPSVIEARNYTDEALFDAEMKAVFSRT